MKKSKFNFVIVAAFLISSIGLTACLDEEQYRINCNPFSPQNDLGIFAGTAGDTITFVNQFEQQKSFTIDDKYILHTTSFVTAIGCNCHDVWGLLLVSGPDSIGVFGQHIYNQFEEVRFFNINLRIDDDLTSLNTNHRSVLSTFRVGGTEFRNVVRFQNLANDSLEFRTVYLVRERGIVQMERANGEIWINTQLDRHMPAEFNTFRFSERTCE